MNWGILGTGKISTRFAAALNNIPAEAQMLAVGSRNQESADAFGDKFNIARRYASYAEVAADPELDIVYIGTPGVFHHRDATMCLEAGKHVLCEKAFTINAGEAEDLIRLARSKNLFLMEAMWTRFLPIHVRIRELLARNEIGKILAIVVNFASDPPRDPANRFFDVNLGAGVLLDTGSYGISWAYSLLGTPDAISGQACFGETGSDDTIGISMKYNAGSVVSIMCSQIAYDLRDAAIVGTKGKIVVHSPWYKTEAATLYRTGQAPELISIPFGDFNGYEYEAREVMACIASGKIESEIMPLGETLAIMQTMDGLRELWGIKYPNDLQPGGNN